MTKLDCNSRNSSCRRLSKIRGFLIFLSTSLLVISFAHNAKAQTSDGPQAYTIYHENMLNSYNLPLAGGSVELKVQLLNAKDVNIPMLAIVVHDDRLVQIKPEKVFLNQFENVEYLFKTFAPIAKLQYQFFSKQSDEQAMISNIFTVDRECRYPVAPYSVELPETLMGTERASKVIEATQALERDIFAYDQALDLIGKIKEELVLIKQRTSDSK